LPPEEHFTRYDLGLHDSGGDEDNAPILRTISKGKAPGTDFFLDKLLWERPDIRGEMFDNVYRIFNKGVDLRDEEMIGKVMLLIKKQTEPVTFSNIRLISILQVQTKLVQAVILRLIGAHCWRHVDKNQNGAKQGSNTQAQVVKMVDEIRKA